MSLVKSLYDDAAMVALIANGDELGMEQLFKQYYKLLCSIAYRLVQDGDNAEDVVQDVLHKVWQRRKKLPADTDLKAYLSRAVRNASLNQLRVSKRFTGFEEQLIDARQQVSRAASDDMIFEELNQKVTDAIGRLPDRCREVFELSRFEELSQKEIAARLDISVKTVENQMTKALKRLREELAPYMNDLPASIIAMLFFQ